jgi:hypothetical protein
MRSGLVPGYSIFAAEQPGDIGLFLRVRPIDWVNAKEATYTARSLRKTCKELGCMSSGLKLLSLVGAGGLLAHLMTTSAFRRRTDALIARLEYPSVAGASTSPVPDTIQSSVRHAVLDDRVPDTVRLSQRGEMRADFADRWRPFIAEQVISIREPGFVWRACVQPAPLVSARILDCYVDGEGLLEVRIFGSWRLARAAGPQAGTAELMRYLAELPWAPHAMLHNPRLSWREIDATTIEVSAERRASPARVRLIFENGDIIRIEADDRPRAVGRRLVPTRWEGRCWDYRRMDGCQIPSRAAVSWLLEDGPFEYWRGRVMAFRMK